MFSRCYSRICAKRHANHNSFIMNRLQLVATACDTLRKALDCDLQAGSRLFESSIAHHVSLYKLVTSIQREVLCILMLFASVLFLCRIYASNCVNLQVSIEFHQRRARPNNKRGNRMCNGRVLAQPHNLLWPQPLRLYGKRGHIS